MIRVLAFIKRRPDVTRAFFRDHYETTHVETALPQLGGIVRYERRHVREELHGSLGFDCMTTFDYRDAAAIGAAFARIESPAGDAIRRDEQRFMDKPANFYFPVELGVPWPGEAAPAGDERLLVCVRRAAPQAPADFRRGFEDEALPALRTALNDARWCQAAFSRAAVAQGAGFDAVVELAAPGAGSLAGWARRLEGAGARVVAARVSLHQTAMAE